LIYSDLSEEYKEKFLSYAISVDQLINASDDDVLEIFARLNSYNVRLNEAELRHAEFQGDFKWEIHESSRRWKILWEEFEVVSVRQRVRMQDDSLVAEMVEVILEGIKDGGQANINRLYGRYDGKIEEVRLRQVVNKLDDTLETIVKNFYDILFGPIARGPHFLMLFAAVAHALHGIPKGDLEVEVPRDPKALTNLEVAKENLLKLNEIIENDVNPSDRSLQEFWRASQSSTQRLSSREKRFPLFFRALLAQKI